MKKIPIIFLILCSLFIINRPVLSLENAAIPFGSGIPLKDESAVREYFLGFGIRASTAIETSFWKIDEQHTKEKIQDRIALVEKVLKESENIHPPLLCQKHFETTIELLKTVLSSHQLALNGQLDDKVQAKGIQLMTIRQKQYFEILFKIYTHGLPNINPYGQDIAV